MINGQYQIGSLVLGRGTRYQIAEMTATGYSSNPGDIPLPKSDELRFRKDYLQPGQLQFKVNILDNYNIDGSPDNFTDADVMLEKLAYEWRADDIRKVWGYVKPITYRQNNSTRLIYGRPREFSSSVRQHRPGAYVCTLAFQRVDTVTYDSVNKAVTLTPAAKTGRLKRTAGEAYTWMEIYLTGPWTHPMIYIGPYVIDLNYTLAAGEIVQINSYPWERRVVSSNGQNLATKLIGQSPYLDELKIPPYADWTVTAGGGSLTGAAKAQILWKEAYQTL